MNELLAFLIGLFVGVAGAGAGAWAVLQPVRRAERVADRLDLLLGNRKVD